LNKSLIEVGCPSVFDQKVGHVPIFGFEEAGHTKSQSIFQAKRLKELEY
jgi:hypothetical protein